MANSVQHIGRAARSAAEQKNWPQVKVLARDILSRRRDSAEGYFLLGLAESAADRHEQAMRAFTRAISLDDSRYDAAAELASLHMRKNQCGIAVKLIEQYETLMADSPRYLDIAATIYTDAGLPERGWPLYQRANELQPDVSSLLAKFAACSVYVGKIGEAQEIYSELLAKAPGHQRNHYELSKLSRAKDTEHIEVIRGLLSPEGSSPEKNIYAYYALGKELEDLQRWDEAFAYFEKAGAAAASVANYDVEVDVRLIDRIIEVCNKEWLVDRAGDEAMDQESKIPIFIVGLPRTGTTLTERILSSHSRIESVGESFFMRAAIKELSRTGRGESMSPDIIAEASRKDIRRVAKAYRQSIEYRFGERPMFIEKLPENFLYLGFIAKAFPSARIVHLSRNPMDACFAMFKQSFFRYAYSLQDLGAYYVACHRLHTHWREVLRGRLVEVEYEALVGDQEGQTRRLLEQIGLDFEDACLSFEKNHSASNTASTVQIREKIHSRSVDRWKRYETQLEPLRAYLEDAGIDLT